MFIGHFAPAFAAAAVTPKAPRLGTLFVAAQLVDWAFFVFAWAGIERMRVEPGITVMNPFDLYHLPYTHSLLGTFGWAMLFAGGIWRATKRLAASLIGGAVVVSHWLLDWLVHRPDLTLAGGEAKLGLGLWNYPALAVPLELILTFGALAWFARRTTGKTLPLWLLATFLLAVQAINWLGPPPDTAGAELYATALIAFGLATALAIRVGRTRTHIASP